MSIKVKDIVVNVLSEAGYEVGQYVEKYDVRILPEMITDKKYSEVMYVDDDGAIITKEFGPYAFPADALRLATEEEKNEYEIEKYTLVVDYKGKDFTLPLPVAKTLIDGGVQLGKDNIEANDSLLRYVKDSWDTILKGEEEVKAVLLYDCYEVIRRRISAGRGFFSLAETIITNFVLVSKNNNLKADFVECFYANPVQDKDLYRSIETRGYEIPEAYVAGIKKVSGYICASMLKGMDLYDYIKDNRRYDSYFPHYKQLTVTTRGLDYVMSLDWSRGDYNRLFEKLNMNMEMIKHILINPRRAFAVDMNIWFKSLEWSEIVENIDMFKSCLNSEYDIKRRLSEGKYISPEYVGALFLDRSCSQNLMTDANCKNKSELKLKEMVAFLGGLSEDITLNDIEAYRLDKEGKLISGKATGSTPEPASPLFTEAVSAPRSFGF